MSAVRNFVTALLNSLQNPNSSPVPEKLKEQLIGKLERQIQRLQKNERLVITPKTDRYRQLFAELAPYIEMGNDFSLTVDVILDPKVALKPSVNPYSHYFKYERFSAESIEQTVFCIIDNASFNLLDLESIAASLREYIARAIKVSNNPLEFNRKIVDSVTSQKSRLDENFKLTLSADSEITVVGGKPPVIVDESEVEAVVEQPVTLGDISQHLKLARTMLEIEIKTNPTNARVNSALQSLLTATDKLTQIMTITGIAPPPPVVAPLVPARAAPSPFATRSSSTNSSASSSTADIASHAEPASASASLKSSLQALIDGDDDDNDYNNHVINDEEMGGIGPLPDFAPLTAFRSNLTTGGLQLPTSPRRRRKAPGRK